MPLAWGNSNSSLNYLIVGNMCEFRQFSHAHVLSTKFKPEPENLRGCFATEHFAFELAVKFVEPVNVILIVTIVMLFNSSRGKLKVNNVNCISIYKIFC